MNKRKLENGNQNFLFASLSIESKFELTQIASVDHGSVSSDR